MKNRFSIFFLFLTYSTVGNACSCAQIELAEYFDNCKQLFTATLFEAKISDKDSGSVIGHFRNPQDIMKGIPSIIRGIKTSMIGTSCEVDILVGKQYLVCGNDDKYINISGCSLTEVIWWQPMRTKVDKLKKLAQKLQQFK